MLIAFKTGLRAIVGQRRGHLELASGTRLLTLTGHGGIETCLIHIQLAFTTDIGGQIQRETIGIV